MRREHNRLHQNSKQLTVKAQELRRSGTPAETTLWHHLRGRQLCGHKFRRQHVIGHFIADFYCAEAKLVIELDGAVHQESTQQIRDQIREEILYSYGFKCLRFSNDEVKHQIATVLRTIAQNVAEISNDDAGAED